MDNNSLLDICLQRLRMWYQQYNNKMHYTWWLMHFQLDNNTQQDKIIQQQCNWHRWDIAKSQHCLVDSNTQWGKQQPEQWNLNNKILLHNLNL